MLQLSNAILNRPVMSLRTGTQIINPNNLKIEGFFCQDSVSRKELVLVAQDVRDIIAQGIVVNDYDVLMEPDDLVRLRDILSWRFELIGKQVVTDNKKKIGKVEDYATELESLYIQKLYVSQSIFKNFSGGNLGVDRSQIVEINEKQIVIHDPLQKLPARVNAVA
jgi:sporulation protein YlmC with PRC-barrel domain